MNDTPLYTKYLMDKYGVAWFKFDEDSENIKDSKGSSVGTIFGVSRVNGWNEKGKALSFNGTNSYASFDTKPFPNGKKSIRFKIMTSTMPTTYIYFMSCLLNFTTSTGEWISIDSSGKLNFGYFPGGNSSTSSNRIDSTISVADGKWHDILLTWDGTTSVNGIKLYIDNMKIPNAQATASTTNIINSNNMYLGVSANYIGQSSRYFNGQIDEVEIYNDVINPIANRILLQSNSQTMSIKDSTLVKIDSPTELTFIKYGQEQLEISQTFNGVADVTTVNEIIGSGKKFTHAINLTKHKGKKIIF